jgi:hypothetical protein
MQAHFLYKIFYRLKSGTKPTILVNLLHNKSLIELPMFSVAPMGSSSPRQNKTNLYYKLCGGATTDSGKQMFINASSAHAPKKNN